MTAYDRLQGIFQAAIDEAHNAISQYNQFVQEHVAVVDKIEANIANFEKTGVLECNKLDFLLSIESEEETPSENTTDKPTRSRTVQRTTCSSRSSSKENAGATKRLPRSTQKKALAESDTNIDCKISQNVIVKVERLTEQNLNNTLLKNDVTVKQENTDMPPPLQRPARQNRKRKDTENNSAKVKVETAEQGSKKCKPSRLRKEPSPSRDSDVQITHDSIVAISLCDSIDEDDSAKPRKGRTKTKKNNQVEEVQPPVMMRMTRTKTRKAAQAAENQVEISEDEDRAKALPKDSAPDQANNDDIKGVTSLSKNVETLPLMNETFKLDKRALLNCTVILEKPTTSGVAQQVAGFSKETFNNLHKDLLTDDEDDIVTPPRSAATNKPKQMFSPYARSPVKQRVEAFEKLGAATSANSVPRVTRTKTRAKKQNENEQENKGQNDQEIKDEKKNEMAPLTNGTRNSNIPVAKQLSTTKPRGTPMKPNKVVVHHAFSADRYNVKSFLPNAAENDSLSLSKAKTAVKSSQAEFRERELRRKLIEQEILHNKDHTLNKKEAMLQAKMEEHKRRLEERQLKALQSRKALAEDKQKALDEANRLKKEKIRQIELEKREKLQRQKEETARKRAEAEKRKERRRQMEQQMQGTPPYLKFQAPYLPTEDCYDSDDSNGKLQVQMPKWQQREVLVATLKNMRYIDVLTGNFFNTFPQTVDLKQIFPTIEPKQLKRTSSAVWNRSQLPGDANEEP